MVAKGFVDTAYIPQRSIKPVLHMIACVFSVSLLAVCFAHLDRLFHIYKCPFRATCICVAPLTVCARCFPFSCKRQISLNGIIHTSSFYWGFVCNILFTLFKYTNCKPLNCVKHFAVYYKS